jgi:hypothetical protein
MRQVRAAARCGRPGGHRVGCGKEEINVKKLLVLVIIAVFALCGCASGNFLGFLATNVYVDARDKALQEQQAAEIAQLKAQLAEYKEVKEQAKAAIDQVNESRKTIEDLQALARRAEARIGAIPKEVMRQIVDILQEALSR